MRASPSPAWVGTHVGVGVGGSVSSPVHVVCRWAGRSAASGPIPDAGQAVHSKLGKLPSGRYDNVFILEIEGGTEFSASTVLLRIQAAPHKTFCMFSYQREAWW